jgi:hypothetical protein
VPAASSDAELEAQISDLQAQLASRRATTQRTVVEHHAGQSAPTPGEAPAEDAPSAPRGGLFGLGGR